jgi:predicted membrane protein
MDTQTMNIIAVITGPIIAIIITLLYQSHKEKQAIKHRIFLTLMAHRKSNPPTIALVEVLNTLDAVFEDTPKVVQLWHEYFDLLCTQPPNYQLWDHKYIDLLSEIAQSLDYKKLKQTDIEKFYIPQSHIDQFLMNAKVQQELLRVLENTASLVVTNKENDKT